MAASLILHGRTEIKARASVLGEVGALSFSYPTLSADFADYTHSQTVQTGSCK